MKSTGLTQQLETVVLLISIRHLFTRAYFATYHLRHSWALEHKTLPPVGVHGHIYHLPLQTTSLTSTLTCSMVWCLTKIGAWDKILAIYTASTTGETRNNAMRSQYALLLGKSIVSVTFTWSRHQALTSYTTIWRCSMNLWRMIWPQIISTTPLKSLLEWRRTFMF